MQSFLVGCVFFLLFPYFSIAGGGWTPDKGNGFFSFSQRSTSGIYWASTKGKIGQTPRASYYSTSIYGEYGISNQWCGLIYSPFLSVAQQAEGIDEFGNSFEADHAIGIGDLDIGIKRSILNKKIAISSTLWLGLPTGDFNAGKTNELHLGDGEFNQLLQLDVSKGFGKFWGTIYMGFNNRTNRNSDDVHFGGEIGYKTKRLVFITKLNGRYSTFNGNRPETNYPSLYSNNIEYFGINTQAMYFFKNNWGIVLDAGFAAHYRNIITVPSLGIGLVYDLKRAKS